MRRRRPLWGLLFGFLVGMTMASGPPRAEDLTLLLTQNTPPLGYRSPEGTPAGFNMDLAQAVCQRMKATCHVQLEPFAAILDTVAEDRAHIGFGNFLLTPERQRRALFSAPLWRSSSSLVGAADLGTVSHPAAQMVAGRRLAVVIGSAQHIYARAHWPEAKLVEVLTPTACFEAMRDGQADLTIQAMVMALPFLKGGAWGALAFIGPRLDDTGLGGTVHAAMPLNRPDLKARFDQALAEIIAEGTYHRISRQWLPFDMY